MFIPLLQTAETETLLRDLPQVFPSPFSNKVHPLARAAALQLQQLLGRDESFGGLADDGKMFGVLVVRHKERIGLLAGFSGMLAGRWVVEGFVPPLFDIDRASKLLADADTQIKNLDIAIGGIREQRRLSGASSQLQQLQHTYAIFDENLKQQHLQSRERRRIQRQHATLQPNAQEILQTLDNESRQERRFRKDQRQAHQSRIAFVHYRLASFDQKVKQLEEERSSLSRRTQMELFALYLLLDKSGRHTPLTDLIAQMQTHYPSDAAEPAAQQLRNLQRYVPGGTGDCAAPKLLGYAFAKKMQPLAMAEFWWGASTPSEVRHHGQFYPSCRGKCGIVLPVMLRGITVDSSTAPQSATPQSATPPSIGNSTAAIESSKSAAEPTSNASEKLSSDVLSDDAIRDKTIVDADTVTEAIIHEAIIYEAIIYEDGDLAVLNKPAGWLSVPGKTLVDSVLTRLGQIWSADGGAFPVHRLDMDTSGCLLVAKNAQAQRILQAQFQSRRIHKIYEALLVGKLNALSGQITLPLCADLLDRPRQLVSIENGKSCLTHWKLLGPAGGRVSTGSALNRVEFNPVTGRTHQLRVHAAHPQGLNAPILGDVLYGYKLTDYAQGRRETADATDSTGRQAASERMMLHAVRLEFSHPVSGKKIVVTSPAPF